MSGVCLEGDQKYIFSFFLVWQRPAYQRPALQYGNDKQQNVISHRISLIISMRLFLLLFLRSVHLLYGLFVQHFNCLHWLICNVFLLNMCIVYTLSIAALLILLSSHFTARDRFFFKFPERTLVMCALPSIPNVLWCRPNVPSVVTSADEKSRREKKNMRAICWDFWD